MSYKKFLIFDCMDHCIEYMENVNSMMRSDAYIKSQQIWSDIKEVGWQSGKTGGRYYVVTPPVEYLGNLTNLIDEDTDQDPSYMEENIYLLYNHINTDVKNRCLNLVTRPDSIDYKKDVNKKFPKKYVFDQYGHLINVIYCESVINTFNPVTKLVSREYGEELIECAFSYTWYSNKYSKTQEAKRRWKREDGTWSEWLVKTKNYSDEQAQVEGVRRRGNVVNDLKKNVAGAILQTQGVDLVQAEILGKPAINKLNVSDFIQNNTLTELVDQVDALDDVEFPWLNNTVIPANEGNPSVNVRDFAKSIIINSDLPDPT